MTEAQGAALIDWLKALIVVQLGLGLALLTVTVAFAVVVMWRG